MSEDGEVWRAIKKDSQAKRWSNRDKSIEILERAGFKVETLNSASAHYRIDGWNFWPTTGTFYHAQKDIKGRGVFNLLKWLRGEKGTLTTYRIK